MLASVREAAGLGSPPIAYTTNRNESMNKVAKLHVNYCQSSWVQLTNSMFTLVTDQLKQVEKAVIGMGEYQFKPSYRCLEISSDRWFMMSSDQTETLWEGV